MTGFKDPYNHCAFNVALYGLRGPGWAMTERGRKSLHQAEDVLTIGPSSLAWRGGVLEATFDEISAPLPRRLKGRVRLTPKAAPGRAFPLDGPGRHVWTPFAPRAEVEVNLEHPGLSWRGEGYFDSNSGEEPLEQAFDDWNWSRVHRPDDTLIFYDVARRGEAPLNLALRLDQDGALGPAPPRPEGALRRGFWGVERRPRLEAGARPTAFKSLEDAPFYTRSCFEADFDGHPGKVFHESLSLGRLRSPIVRGMLPFRMPRRFF